MLFGNCDSEVRVNFVCGFPFYIKFYVCQFFYWMPNAEKPDCTLDLQASMDMHSCTPEKWARTLIVVADVSIVQR